MSAWVPSRGLVCIGSTKYRGNKLVNRVGILVDAGFPVLVGARDLTGIARDIILAHSQTASAKTWTKYYEDWR